ncbi:MAG: mechanosensitive ion channel family protein [Chitinophagales bacterium]
MQEEINNLTDLFMSSLQTFTQVFMSALPKVVGAIFLLLFGWMFAKLISFTVSKLLKIIKFNDLSQKVNTQAMLQKANIQSTPSDLVSKFIYWIIMLLVLVMATDTLGLQIVSQEISKLISLLPTLLSAIILFIVGIYIATFIRDVTRAATSTLSIGAGKVISNVVFYFLAIIVTLTALKQAGIDTSIITSNVTLILGAFLAGAALAYGLAARNVLTNMLGSFFNRQKFVKGQLIEVAGVSGRVVDMDNISITIATENEDLVVLPAKILLDEQVRIKKVG